WATAPGCSTTRAAPGSDSNSSNSPRPPGPPPSSSASSADVDGARGVGAPAVVDHVPLGARCAVDGPLTQRAVSVDTFVPGVHDATGWPTHRRTGAGRPLLPLLPDPGACGGAADIPPLPAGVSISPRDRLLVSHQHLP